MKTGLLYGIEASSKARVRCVFCGVYIPKANKCIEQHTNGVKHKENIELMSENGISLNNGKLYCKPCKKNILEDESIAKHIEGNEHANWSATLNDLIDGEFISIESYLASEKDEVYCEVCNCEMSSSLNTIEEHVNSFNHRSNIVERLKPLNGLFPVDNGDEVWCKICDAYIDNTVQSILDHIDGDDEHIEWFSEIEDFVESQDISIEDYLLNEHEVNAYCNRCNTEVVCLLQNLEDHVISENHLSLETQSS